MFQNKYLESIMVLERVVLKTSEFRKNLDSYMKNVLVVLSLCLFYNIPSAQVNYPKYFTNECLRIHYFHYGTNTDEEAILADLYQDSLWAGSKINLIDTLNLGNYLIQVYDLHSNMLIYSYGFSTLFNEWQTTSEANAGNTKIIGEIVRIPFPRQEVRIVFLTRDKKNYFTHTIGNWTIDPNSWKVSKEKKTFGVSVFNIQVEGEPANKVDLAIIAEGYLASEMEKFKSDARNYTDHLFDIEPFKMHRNNFNVYGVFKASKESGPDDPAKGTYKNTAVNCSFNTFGSQRYLMTFDQKSLTDIASAVPYDAIYILVNTDVYGGGGIYNFFACSAAGNRWSKNVFVHELGHSFAGLGDEYYTSDVAYTEFYPKDVEPWEPNLTILSNPNHLKWEKFILAGTPIPTPWDKEKYDLENQKYAKNLKELNTKSASNHDINKMREKHKEWINDFFEENKHKNIVGAFEGAGYSSKNLYRPALECVMFSNRKIKFDPVCANAIEKRIRFLVK